ncbi:MAG: rod shape-determining protein MreC [Candidatus Nanopelagicales bacterium]
MTTTSPTRLARPTPPPDLRQRRWRRFTPGPVAALLLLVSLSLMFLDLRGGPTDTLRGVTATVVGPAQAASDALFGPVRAAALRRVDADELERQITELQDTNRRLQAANDQLTRQLADDPAARKAAEATQSRAEAAVAARVVAAAPGLATQALTIDVGSDDGVARDAPVLVSGGVIGRVTDVTPSTSTVLLVTDPGSSVAVRVNGNSALLQGTGDRHAAVLSYLDPLADVRVGQRVETLGSDDGKPYPAGLPVGTVSAVSGDLGDLDRVVTVEPALPAGMIDRVIVLTDPPDPSGAGDS